MTIVLMYHGLYRGNDTSLIDAEDLPYAVSEEQFVAQLDAIKDRNVDLIREQAQTAPDIVITFDDGHISNFDIAMPLLAERGMQAYLFVTSGFVGERPHFVSPNHLRQMAAAGMEIGSHGVTHRFFDDLDEKEAERELVQSRERLSEQCGETVRSISFPGGRYKQQTLELCRRLGYAQLFGSGLGTVTEPDLVSLEPLNRVAIRRTTSLKEFNRIVSPDPVYYAVQKNKQRGKLLVKRILGNRLYHGLYKSISAR